MSCPVSQSAAAGARACLESLGAGLLPANAWWEAQVVDAPELPDLPQRLLVHNRHMTATLNAHYGESVELRVLDVRREADTYQRMILLTVGGGEKVVEFGIVRLYLSALPQAAQNEVMLESRPLGEILARHGVLTQVEPRWYLRFPATSPVVDYFAPDASDAFGRLGIIHCNGQPAVELLEVVPAEIDTRQSQINNRDL